MYTQSWFKCTLKDHKREKSNYAKKCMHFFYILIIFQLSDYSPFYRDLVSCMKMSK